MSTVSQRVPSFLLGISQQPDNKKIPGQINEALNAYPDYVNGLVKRPGAEFFGELIGAGTDSSNSFWFNINRDDAEKYVGQYDLQGDQLKIWKHPYPRTTDGIFDQPELAEVKAVRHYAGATAYTTSYETEANNYNTALQNVQATLGTLNEALYDLSLVEKGQSTTKEVLFEVSESYTNDGQVHQTLKSGAFVSTNASGTKTIKVLDNGTLVSATSAYPAGYTQSNERTTEYPLLTPNGERVYEVEKAAAATHDSADLSAAQSAAASAQTNYDNAVTTLQSTRTALESAISGNDNQAGSSYLSTVTSPQDIAVLNVIDKTFVVNKKVTPALKADLSPPTPLEAFVVLDIITPSASYVVQLTWRNTSGTVVSFNYSYSTASDSSNAQTVLDNLKNLINNGDGSRPGTTNSGGGEVGHQITARQVGKGLYLSRPASGGNYGGNAFDISTSGSANRDGLFAFQQSLNSSSKLPVECKAGYVVKITNSGEVDADDYYVKFACDNELLDYGPGSWEETIEPNIKYKIDADTMPHVLTRKSNGHFELKPTTWDDRLVGSETTNPTPTFIGEPIQGIFFYRNRLGFLAGQTVILSRANDFFNFWGKTALTVSDDDPIDIDCTSTKPQTLRYVVPQTSGLVIFGQGEQFLLSTDTDILSPKTAKVNRFSNFNTSQVVEPLDTGIGIGFLGTTGPNTRHFELFGLRTDAPAKAAETSLPVSDLIPNTIDIYKNEPNLSVITLGTKNQTDLFLYRYLQQGDRRSVEGWFKWRLNEPMQYMYFDKGESYVVTQATDDRVYLSRITLQQFAEDGAVRSNTRYKLGAVGNNTKVTDIKLDQFYPGCYREYDNITDETTITAPYGSFNRVVAFELLDLNVGNEITNNHTSAALYSVTTTQDADGNATVTVPGDLRDKHVYIGNAYNLEVVLPRPYIVSRSGEGFQTDTSANLIIHRMKINCGFGGPLKYRLEISGRADNEEVETVVFPPIYAANTIPVTTESVHQIPIQQRNTNFSVTLIGDTPYPITLQSYDWEGRYTTNFYRRSAY